jgi:hypothetical protein
MIESRRWPSTQRPEGDVQIASRSGPRYARSEVIAWTAFTFARPTAAIPAIPHMVSRGNFARFDLDDERHRTSSLDFALRFAAP